MLDDAARCLLLGGAGFPCPIVNVRRFNPACLHSVRLVTASPDACGVPGASAFFHWLPTLAPLGDDPLANSAFSPCANLLALHRRDIGRQWNRSVVFACCAPSLRFRKDAHLLRTLSSCLFLQPGTRWMHPAWECNCCKRATLPSVLSASKRERCAGGFPRDHTSPGAVTEKTSSRTRNPMLPCRERSSLLRWVYPLFLSSSEGASPASESSHIMVLRASLLARLILALRISPAGRERSHLVSIRFPLARRLLPCCAAIPEVHPDG